MEKHIKIILQAGLILVCASGFAETTKTLSKRKPARDISNQVLFTANDSQLVGSNAKECAVGVLQIFRDNDRLYVISSNRQPQVQRIDLTKGDQQRLASFDEAGSHFSIERDGRRIDLKVDDTDKVPGVSATIRENDGTVRSLYQGPNGSFTLGCDNH